MSDESAPKPHRKRQAGPKADKKKPSTDQPKEENAARRNPRAFSFQHAVAAERRFRRTEDIKTRKERVPEVDRTPEEPPPFLVAVVGPPKVGKSTLVRAIVRHHTRQRLTETAGPITIVASKKRRVTLIECPNNIEAMCDVAKVADLVLLLIDASFGFEMEVFEFMNLCQIHGMPKIMGVLTHLDLIQNQKQLRRTKKRLKQRFWVEIYQGAKLFYLSGMPRGDYMKNEIHNLCRFISVMKFRQPMWRNTHPFIVADRVEDLTDPEAVRANAKCDRKVSLYGYVRGTFLKPKSHVHVPGVGDLFLHDVNALSDPCPLPQKEGKRSLNEKERLLYAPMAGVGGLVYDRDAVYIDLGGSHSQNSAVHPLVEQLQKSQSDIGRKIAHEDLQLLSDEPPGRRRVVFEEDDAQDDEAGSGHEEDDDDEGVDEEGEDEDAEQEDDAAGVMAETEEDDDDDEGADQEEEDSDEEEEGEDDEEGDEEESEEEAPLWKKDLAQKAAQDFLERKRKRRDWNRIVYDVGEDEDSSDEDGEELGGLFRMTATDKPRGQETDCSRCNMDELDVPQQVEELIRDCFVTGKWEKDKDAAARLQLDDELYGDFEDLETGQKVTSGRARKKAGEDDEGDEDDEFGGFDDDEDASGGDAMEDEEDGEEGGAKKGKDVVIKDQKEKKKAMFDAEYDAGKSGGSTFLDEWKESVAQQAELNRKAFADLDERTRQELEGIRPGTYVRVEIDQVPCEFVESFDSRYPIVVGVLASSEMNVGILVARFRRHRWQKRIFKSRDPMLFSLGWRRFQSIPLFSIEDHNGRRRLLKYTPEHMHCLAAFWGPITPQNTGILAMSSSRRDTNEFRISGTGVLIDLDKGLDLVKKLKLIGTPLKIHKKTVFVKGMFNSALEVAKFEGAAIRSVSGVRGQIKKATRDPPGAFRATFEDKLIPSDIVFVRTWVAVEVPHFYNPSTTLLLPAVERENWRRMKTLGEIKRERGIQGTPNPDSLYKPVERKERLSLPLVIPRALQQNLPFAFKPKSAAKKKNKLKRVTVVPEPEEEERSRLLHMMKTVRKVRQQKKRRAMVERVKEFHKKMGKVDEKKKQKQKEMKKKYYQLSAKS